MKRISEIHDQDVGLQPRDVTYTTRTAARAVLRNKGKIALLHVSKHHYYKIPGGGIKKGESIKEGLQREVLEETGCTFTIQEDIGEIVEYKSHDQEMQTSYCFLADVVSEGTQNFTKREQSHGFRLVWKPFEEALDLVKNSRPTTYFGKFIVLRDLLFLEKAQKYFKE